MAQPVGAPVALPGMPTAVPIAEPGNPTDRVPGRGQARYGRLTNPDLLVGVGDWVRVQSTFLWAIRFVPYAEAEDAPVRSSEQQVGDLYIETNDGWIGKSEGRTYQDYRAYLTAPSKGKFHRRTPWYHSMQTVRAQIYRGKALTARIKANT